MKKLIFSALFLAAFCTSSFAIDIASLLRWGPGTEWDTKLWGFCSDKCEITLGIDRCGQGFPFTGCMQNCYDMYKK